MLLRINTPKDKEGVLNYITRLPDNIRFTVAVNKVKSIRSISQNSTYWMWLKCIEDETGMEKADLHQYFGERFLTPETALIFGVEIERTPTTTKLNTAEFTAYLEKIEVFASRELGIILPRPSDQHFEEMYQKYSYSI